MLKYEFKEEDEIFIRNNLAFANFYVLNGNYVLGEEIYYKTYEILYKNDPDEKLPTLNKIKLNFLLIEMYLKLK